MHRIELIYASIKKIKNQKNLQLLMGDIPLRRPPAFLLMLVELKTVFFLIWQKVCTK